MCILMWKEGLINIKVKFQEDQIIQRNYFKSKPLKCSEQLLMHHHA